MTSTCIATSGPSDFAWEVRCPTATRDEIGRLLSLIWDTDESGIIEARDTATGLTWVIMTNAAPADVERMAKDAGIDTIAIVSVIDEI